MCRRSSLVLSAIRAKKHQAPLNTLMIKKLLLHLFYFAGYIFEAVQVLNTCRDSALPTLQHFSCSHQLRCTTQTSPKSQVKDIKPQTQKIRTSTRQTAHPSRGICTPEDSLLPGSIFSSAPRGHITMTLMLPNAVFNGLLIRGM